MPGFTCPIQSNCGHPGGEETVVRCEAGSVPQERDSPIPATFDWRSVKGWQHPATDALGTHNMLHHVTSLRGAPVRLPPALKNGVGPFPPLDALVAQHAPFAYRLNDAGAIKAELMLRGPLLTTFSVTAHFCTFWSALLVEPHGKPFVEKKHDKAVATVVVAVLGWTSDNAWLVGHAWGSMDSDVNAYGRNGCFLWKREGAPECVGVLPERPAVGTDTGLSVSVLKYEGTPVKAAVKAKITLGHGRNKGSHPAQGKPRFDQFKQKVSAGDIATITLMGIVCAAIAVCLCLFFTRSRTPSGTKQIKHKKVKTA